MKDVRSLDYNQQYKVCEKFYWILKSLHEDSRVMCQRFYESFEMIDPEGLEEYMVKLHWTINDMDNALYETDTYTPIKFFEIAEKLALVRSIQLKRKSASNLERKQDCNSIPFSDLLAVKIVSFNYGPICKKIIV